MEAHEDKLNKMLAVWNTHDEAEKAALVEEALEHNVHFADPNHNIIGRGAFLKMVRQVQEKFPSAVYSRASDVDIQNNFCRYHWTVHVEGEPVMTGFDVTEVNDTGKIVKVIGFFGELGRS